MVVAAAGRQQAEIMTEGKQAGSFGIRLVGVEDLHARQAYGGQPGDLFVGDQPIPPGPRVRQHRGPARGADQPDRVNGIKRVPVHVGPPAVGDPVTGEGVARLRDRAAGRHRAGDVRAADHGEARDGGYLIPADVHAEVGEPAHHGPGAQHAVVADPAEFRGEFRVVRVEQVGQQVHAVIG